tara:strand:+ start:830 stop:1519 length:690 start_codon:yes stop_codon:yes gene_type:complete
MKLNTIICGDAEIELHKIRDKTIDCVLTDPPYNASNSQIHLEDKRFKAIAEEWDINFAIDYIHNVFRILKDNGSALIFCSYHLLRDYLNAIDNGGFEKDITLRQILHFHKPDAMYSVRKYYTFSIEYILWITKGNSYTFNKEFAKTNLMSYNVVRGKKRFNHPSPKPLDLIRNLIMVHTKKDDIILDAFAGTGQTCVAAKELGRQYIGIEINPEYCDTINARLQQDYLF